MSSRNIALGIAGAALCLAMLAFGFAAGSRTGAAVAPLPIGEAMNRAEVEATVRNYLLSNPDILVEMQVALEALEREDQRVTQVQTIVAQADEIFNAPYDGIVGNPEGGVTIVEFFDYNCGFCRRAMEDMDALVAADPDLRFVLKEFPILGPDSQRAHVVSMAFRALAPERYGDFHRELMTSSRATEQAAIRVALAHGIDEAELRAEMENPAIAEAFGRTYELANRLAITGTPSYVIGDEVVFGALGQAVLEEKIDLVRAD